MDHNEIMTLLLEVNEGKVSRVLRTVPEQVIPLTNADDLIVNAASMYRVIDLTIFMLEKVLPYIHISEENIGLVSLLRGLYTLCEHQLANCQGLGEHPKPTYSYEYSLLSSRLQYAAIDDATRKAMDHMMQMINTESAVDLTGDVSDTEEFSCDNIVPFRRKKLHVVDSGPDCA